MAAGPEFVYAAVFNTPALALVQASDNTLLGLQPVGPGGVNGVAVVGDRVVASAKDLAKAKVKATIVGESKGPKIVGFTYKNKTNQRKRWGHRQHYSTIEITGITSVPKG